MGKISNFLLTTQPVMDIQQPSKWGELGCFQCSFWKLKLEALGDGQT